MNWFISTEVLLMMTVTRATNASAQWWPPHIEGPSVRSAPWSGERLHLSNIHADSLEHHMRRGVKVLLGALAAGAAGFVIGYELQKHDHSGSDFSPAEIGIAGAVLGIPIGAFTMWAITSPPAETSPVQPSDFRRQASAASKRPRASGRESNR